MEALMAELKDLREQMGNILTEARAKIDQIKDDTPEERAAEIEREYDAMMADYDKLSARAERTARLDNAVKHAEAFAEDVHTGRRPQSEGRAAGVDEGERMTYRTAFHAYVKAGGNIGAMDPEARSVLQAGYQSIPKEERAQTSGTNSAGGFTVPTELLQIIEVAMKAHGPMYDGSVITEIVTNGGGQLTMPTVDDTAVTAGAHTEGATLTDDGGKDVTFGEKALDAFAFNTEWLRVSRELADDSIFAMENLIGQLLGERLARIANAQLTTGSGSSAPNGIVTASAEGKEANATAAITWDEVLDLEHSVDPAYRTAPKVAYMFNDATLKVLRQLKDGDGNYLWQMGNVQAGVPNTFNGRTYYVNQDMASLGAAAKVMLFGDFGKYYVRKVGQPLIGAIEDKDFWPGFGMAGYIRFDGELSNTAAVKHLITAAS
jgi:HK97 family phage major capsid protein